MKAKSSLRELFTCDESRVDAGELYACSDSRVDTG